MFWEKLYRHIIYGKVAICIFSFGTRDTRVVELERNENASEMWVCYDLWKRL